ncbi:AAA family ATPase [Rhizobium sp. CG5]|uniref:bifunctional aminoglycoside phosphotransferase/ATP-binding protein n=1 Tax=Rhizobium sp. CG5 TaxID=2726076 RepID=UPI0020348D5C|nr:bifunctional aminoglycoside phosphotransferase/ATP-binding protein [Rhizobium sp. CG5]MCM2475982.1 AAA family ATPase [Rhizobium sp. CG5]
MDIQDQTAAIAFLSDAKSYGQTGKVKIIETHISLVFLIEARAFKLKRAVKLPYVDFSTYDLRLAFCEREIELNRRAAPDLYLGVRRITREADGRLAFDGSGEPVDAVVEMERFRQHNLFDRMATEGKLTKPLMEETAVMITEFHAKAPVMHGVSGSANMAGVLDINEGGFATSEVFAKPDVTALTAAFRQAWTTHVEAMDSRETAGKVRLCHGDLHLRNIYMTASGPRLFDCIDFNDQIATIDTLYDLAFLLMDLWHRGFPQFANTVVNRYLDVTGDDDGFTLLPFFMAVRAAVRAHVTGTQIAEIGDGSGDLTASATSYFDFARELLKPAKPRLVVIGGFSGSGKSTLAEALAPHIGGPPGARMLESDRIRKAMFDRPPSEPLPPEAYAPDVSAKVYDSLCRKADSILARNGTVIVNAVFDRAADRAAMEAVAKNLGVPFTGIWLEADAGVLKGRVIARPKGPSDATPEILERQLAKSTGPIDWHHISAAGTPLEVFLRTKQLLASL